MQIGLSLYTNGLLLCAYLEPHRENQVSLLAGRMAKPEACNAPPLHDLSRDQTPARLADEASARRPYPENHISLALCRENPAKALLFRY